MNDTAVSDVGTALTSSTSHARFSKRAWFAGLKPYMDDVWT